jgi:glycosyltransferase involved in cell wall biosynthesis
MLHSYLALTACLWMIALWLTLRGERAYQNLPELKLSPETNIMPSLLIIVPARNEELNLPRLLDSLNTQTYIGNQEIIVVDDQSTDGTARQAELHRARVLGLKHLPAGWLGKPYACQRGAEYGKGDWLLFVDADTAYSPQAITSVMSYAIQNQLDGLSLFLSQKTHNILDALAIATAFTAFFAGTDQPRGILNGQFILLKRAVFESIRGFESVRQEPLEDVALGQHLLKNGFDVPILRGENIGSVQMYPSMRQMWHGLSRLGSGVLTHGKWNSLIIVFVIAQMTSAIILLAAASYAHGIFPLLIVSWLISSLVLLPWAKRVGRPSIAPLAPFGSLLIILASISGLGQRLLGYGMNWKGRQV